MKFTLATFAGASLLLGNALATPLRLNEKRGIADTFKIEFNSEHKYRCNNGFWALPDKDHNDKVQLNCHFDVDDDMWDFYIYNSNLLEGGHLVKAGRGEEGDWATCEFYNPNDDYAYLWCKKV